jgi:DNA-binding NarL/FixJ family response regulator
VRTIEILIADDHAMVRSGLRRIVEGEPGLTVVAEAHDGESTLAALEACNPRILLLDMSMPPPSGPQLIETIRARWPALAVLVVSMHNEPRIVRVALQAGANGYVTKDSDPDTLLEALRRVASGGRFVAPGLADQVAFLPPEYGHPRHVLSPREFEVFERLAAGLSNQEIARELGLSEKTISSHKSNLMAKLAIFNMAELIRLADDYL